MLGNGVLSLRTVPASALKFRRFGWWWRELQIPRLPSCARSEQLESVNPGLSRFVSFLDQAESYFLSLASQQLVLLSLKPVVIHKEILNLVQPLGGKIL